jgi:hypothetical protein
VSPAGMAQQLSKLAQRREATSGFNIGCRLATSQARLRMRSRTAAGLPSPCHLTSKPSVDWRPALRPTDSRAVIGLNRPVKRPSC